MIKSARVARFARVARVARAGLRLLVLAALVAACGSGAAPSSGPAGSPSGPIPVLAGTSWIVVSVGGRAPIPGAVPTVRFDASRVQGTGGCNHFGGDYRLDPATGTFAVDQLASTLVGCVQAGVGAFESALLQALQGSSRASLDDAGRLILDGVAGRIVLVSLEHPATP